MNQRKYYPQQIHYSLVGGLVKIKRVWRSVKMWGVHRTLAKVINRLSLPIPTIIYYLPRKRDFLLVGCGQFGSSTASYFIGKYLGNRFLGCYDINLERAKRFRKSYRYKYACNSYEELIALEEAKYILVASNHASHTDQTIAALEKGLIVHVEKPISVSWEQLGRLVKAVEGKENKLYVGYNRPFAKATKIIRENLPAKDGPFTIQYFIAGHAIAKDHWYYDPDEGTRICGNLGHWIDLTIHFLSQRDLPDKWRVNITYSDNSMREENFVLSMSSEKGDLVSITFTTRGEPFDGVNESINLQQGSMMAKIEDYRILKLWNNDVFKEFKFWPKDVGHKNSILQMFEENPKYRRPWSEVYFSSMLIIHIASMVRNNIESSEFSFSETQSMIEKHSFNDSD